jgi:STE24 endopeptidase
MCVALLMLCATAASAAERRFTVHVTPEMIRHSRLLDTLYFVDFVYAIAVLFLILQTRISRKLRAAAARVFRGPFWMSMLVFVLLTAVAAIFEYPLTFYQGFVVPHQFGLTHQTFGSWMGDFGKGLGVDAALGAPVAALALYGIRRFRRWWVVLWIGSIPLIILGVVITPLIIDPLFNKFEPLQDPVLRRDLLAEAARAGIRGSRVYQVNKSKQTTTMNAYMTGIGPSKRIVIWDTLLQKMDHDEVLAVMGHEMGHYVLDHLWKGMAFGIVVALAVFYFGQMLYERGLARWGARWGVADRADPAALPWLLLVATVIGFLLSPVTNGFSRMIEHDADRFGLDLTHLNGAMASSFVKFAEDSKVDPDPPRFIEWWRYTHPSTQRRIDFALRYHPWTAASHSSRGVAQALHQQLAEGHGELGQQLRLERQSLGERRLFPRADDGVFLAGLHRDGARRVVDE